MLATTGDHLSNVFGYAIDYKYLCHCQSWHHCFQILSRPYNESQLSIYEDICFLQPLLIPNILSVIFGQENTSTLRISIKKGLNRENAVLKIDRADEEQKSKKDALPLREVGSFC